MFCEVYYVLIGPQTNLFNLLKNAPKITEKLNVIIMGGGLEGYRLKDTRAEHNILYDVDSARYVFYNDVKKKYVLGDQTFAPEIMGVDENHEVYKILINTRAGRLIEQGFTGFFDDDDFYPQTIMHDPLTLSTLNQKFVTFEEDNIIMDKNGIMRRDPNGKRTNVSNSADHKEFMKHLIKTISNKG